MTTAPLSPERLAEIERMCAAATPGPWEVGQPVHDAAVIVRLPDFGTMAGCYQSVVRRLGTALGSFDGQDSAFIAASRTAIPELLAEIRRLQSAVDRLANAERDLAETQLVLEQQDRDLERLRGELQGARSDGHAAQENWRLCEEENDKLEERIAALESGLREACDLLGVEGPGALRHRLDNSTRLRALADGVQSSKETT